MTLGKEIVNNSASVFDVMASEYDTWFEKEGKLIYLIELRALQHALCRLPRPWLEVGVGSGRFAQALGIDVGIDPSNKLLALARNRNVKVIFGYGEELPFNDRAFGCILLIVTLCFVIQPLEVLCEARRVLTPEGKIVLGLVLSDNPWGRLYQRKKSEGHPFYKFANFYSYQDVVEMLAQTGFLIEQVISTLFQTPEQVCHIEEPREGYHSEAGFTVIVAKKVRQ